MKKSFIILIGLMLVFTTLSFCGCQENNTTDDNTDDSTVTDPLENLGWSNSEYGIGLNFPDGWTFEDPDVAGGLVRFYGPTVNNFNINTGLAVPTDLGIGTLNVTFGQMITLYEGVFENFTLISQQESTVNNMAAYEIVYNYTLAGINMKQKQIGVEKDQMLYLFTFSAIDSTYDEYVTEFEDSLITFTVL